MHPSAVTCPVRSQRVDFVWSPSSKRDMWIIRGALRVLLNRQFPLLKPRLQFRPVLNIFTDASGGLGEGFGAITQEPSPAAFAMMFPPAFLLAAGGHAHNVPVMMRTSLLELVAPLAALLTFGHRLRGRTVRFWIDNIASVTAFACQKSRDQSVCMLLRLIRIVAARLDVQVVMEHVPRRSDIWSVAADDLTHAEIDKILAVWPEAKAVVSAVPEPVAAFFDLHSGGDVTPLVVICNEFIDAYYN